jgi:hypothetical protein
MAARGRDQRRQRRLAAFLDLAAQNAPAGDPREREDAAVAVGQERKLDGPLAELDRDVVAGVVAVRNARPLKENLAVVVAAGAVAIAVELVAGRIWPRSRRPGCPRDG